MSKRRKENGGKKPSEGLAENGFAGDLAWAAGLAALVLLLILLRDPQGRSFIYAVF